MNQALSSGTLRAGLFSGKLLPLAAAACAGILLADRLAPPLWLVTSITLFLIAAAAASRGQRAGGALVLALTAATFSLFHLVRLDGESRFPLANLLERHSSISVTAVGIVSEEPRTQGRSDRCSYTLQLSRISAPDHQWRTWHRITVSQPGPPPAYGDLVSLQGSLERIRPARNPGEFSLEKFFARKGIVAELYVTDRSRIQLLDRGKGSPFYKIALQSREWIRATITRDLTESPDIGAVLSAMVLGDRSNTPPEIEERFRHSGALHIFAVSGLHVGIFGTIIWTFLRFFGLRRPNTVLIIIPCLFFYAYVTGLRPSAFRAAIMASVFLSGYIFARQPRLLNSLGAAALVILAIDSQQLFLPGFQLSFTVLAFIALLANPIQRPFVKWIEPDPFLPIELVPPLRKNLTRLGRYALGLAAVSAAAWIGSAPLGLWHFQLVTPIAIIANCFLVPLAWLILVIATLSLMAAGIGFSALSVLFNNANWVVAHGILIATSLFSSVPGSHFYVNHFPSWGDDSCRVTVLDTGLGGSSQLISMPGSRSNYLVDAGGRNTYFDSVSPFLRGNLHSDLDGLVITHGDAQHIAGAIPLLGDFPPSVIFQSPLDNRSPYYKGLLESLEASGPAHPSLRSVAAGETIHSSSSGDAILRVLYPPASKRHDYAADDQCLVLQLTCHSWRILFMADSGFTTEKWLLENVGPAALRSDVIVKGQHRSDYSGLPEFLNAVAPRFLVATNFSFPAEEQIPSAWEETLVSREISLLDQSRTGAVTIRCTPDRLTLSSYLTQKSVTITRP